MRSAFLLFALFLIQLPGNLIAERIDVKSEWKFLRVAINEDIILKKETSIFKFTFRPKEIFYLEKGFFTTREADVNLPINSLLVLMYLPDRSKLYCATEQIYFVTFACFKDKNSDEYLDQYVGVDNNGQSMPIFNKIKTGISYDIDPVKISYASDQKFSYKVFFSVKFERIVKKYNEIHFRRYFVAEKERLFYLRRIDPDIMSSEKIAIGGCLINGDAVSGKVQKVRVVCVPGEAELAMFGTNIEMQD